MEIELIHTKNSNAEYNTEDSLRNANRMETYPECTIFE